MLETLCSFSVLDGELSLSDTHIIVFVEMVFKYQGSTSRSPTCSEVNRVLQTL
jgi:hypothetical protein